MKITNNHNLPESIFNAIKNDDYNAGDSDYSITELVQPTQITYLRHKYSEQIIEDASDLVYALMGKAIHYILEKAESVAITEKRLFCEIDGKKISGQPDRLALITDHGQFSGLVQDYKFCSVWEYIYGINDERIEQLNSYAYLLGQNDYKVSKLQVVMIFRDWQLSKAQNDSTYPQQQVAIIDVPLWDEETQYNYLLKKVKLLNSFPIIGCSEKDRWYKGDKYAVYKKGNKTAYRVCDTKKEAELWIAINKKGNNIVFRPGENKRCEKYCNVNQWCDQYKSFSK